MNEATKQTKFVLENRMIVQHNPWVIGY